MEKSYTEQQQISYFEVDNNLYLTPSALVFHLQDTAIRHSDTLGYTLDYMAQHQRGWAVVNWHIIIEHMPKCGEDIKIVTWSSKCRRMQYLCPNCFSLDIYEFRRKKTYFYWRGNGTTLWQYHNCCHRK